MTALRWRSVTVVLGAKNDVRGNSFILQKTTGWMEKKNNAVFKNVDNDWLNVVLTVVRK